VRTPVRPAFERAPRAAGAAGAPFVADLAARAGRPARSFHMPGHKQRVAGNVLLADLCGAAVLGADLSEVGGLDYLHAPAGALREAQALAAAAFGADHTFFLVNGSTVGNQAALLACVGEGQEVLLPRASHRSVFAGLVLAGAVPVYLPSRPHPAVGVPLAADPGPVAALLRAHPGVAAVHLTSPSYQGYGSDLPAFARAAHARGVPLLVDEAHGAHFAFHPRLPAPGLAAGADLAVQSAHKTLGSLTQSSLLHCRAGRVDPGRLAGALALLQSSSPSALLLASLDAARAVMATSGEALLERAIELAEQARAAIRAIPGLWCHGDDLVGRGAVTSHDPTKLLIRVAGLGTTGFAAARWLAAARGIEVEMSGPEHLVCTVTPADSRADLEALVGALGLLSERCRRRSRRGGPALARADGPDRLAAPPLPPVALSPRAAHFAPTRAVPVGEALGEICAEYVLPFPPGIPALVPGEVLDRTTAEYVLTLAGAGARIVGPSDRTLRTLRVVADGVTGRARPALRRA
jgi:arginine decarboxylase